jgi:hypothetical protein
MTASDSAAQQNATGVAAADLFLVKAKAADKQLQEADTAQFGCVYGTALFGLWRCLAVQLTTWPRCSAG